MEFNPVTKRLSKMATDLANELGRPQMRSTIAKWLHDNFIELTCEYSIDLDYLEQSDGKIAEYEKKNAAFRLGEAALENGIFQQDATLVEEGTGFPIREIITTRQIMFVLRNR